MSPKSITKYVVPEYGVDGTTIGGAHWAIEYGELPEHWSQYAKNESPDALTLRFVELPGNEEHRSDSEAIGNVQVGSARRSKVATRVLAGLLEQAANATLNDLQHTHDASRVPRKRRPSSISGRRCVSADCRRRSPSRGRRSCASVGCTVLPERQRIHWYVKNAHLSLVLSGGDSSGRRRLHVEGKRLPWKGSENLIVKATEREEALLEAEERLSHLIRRSRAIFFGTDSAGRALRDTKVLIRDAKEPSQVRARVILGARVDVNVTPENLVNGDYVLVTRGSEPLLIRVAGDRSQAKSVFDHGPEPTIPSLEL